MSSTVLLELNILPIIGCFAEAAHSTHGNKPQTSSSVPESKESHSLPNVSTSVNDKNMKETPADPLITLPTNANNSPTNTGSVGTNNTGTGKATALDGKNSAENRKIIETDGNNSTENRKINGMDETKSAQNGNIGPDGTNQTEKGTNTGLDATVSTTEKGTGTGRRLLQDDHTKSSESTNEDDHKAATVENDQDLEADADSSFELFRDNDELADEYNYDYDDYVDESLWGDEEWTEEKHEKLEDYVNVDSHILGTPVSIYH